GAEALWTVPSTYDAAVAQTLKTRAKKLRWIGMTSVGYDPLLRFGIPKGTIVTNVGGSLSPVVAEHAVMLLLALVRQLPLMHRRQLDAAWDPSVMKQLGSLEDMTVAVVGFGGIGREVARRLRAFDVRIVGVRASGRPDALADEMYPAARLHDALARVDAVVVTVPMNEQTRGLIGAPALAALPPHAFLVNVARGPVVDAAALKNALSENRLAGAALDVADPEPLPPDDPLWSDPRVLITPHIGGFGSIESSRRIVALFERNVANLRAGKPLEAQVAVP
ncbi:MAG TPA: NAD(P)-dependent oxidoreductase, partial [Candidatus Acidoferrales bacterium]|nr:NAD(P)-dependent oxidoreductase [Candidatus Acidoferrales bacterium]